MSDQTPNGETLLEERTLEEWLDLADSALEDAISVRRGNIPVISALRAAARERQTAVEEIEAREAVAFDHHRDIRLSAMKAAREVLADDERSNAERFFAWGLLASDSRDRARELADFLCGIDAYVQANPGTIFVRKGRRPHRNFPQSWVVGRLTGAPLRLSYEDRSFDLGVELSAGTLELSTGDEIDEKVETAQSDRVYSVSVPQLYESASADPEDQVSIRLLGSNYTEEHQTQIFEKVEEFLRQLESEANESKHSAHERETIMRAMLSAGLIAEDQVPPEMLGRWTEYAEKMLGEIFLKLRLRRNALDEMTLATANFIASSKGLIDNYRQAVVDAMAGAMAEELKITTLPYLLHDVEQAAGLHYNIAVNLLGIDDLSREEWFGEIVPRLIERQAPNPPSLITKRFG